jgi:IclR family transcriptional regulator, mhp operon transcriptional activator
VSRAIRHAFDVLELLNRHESLRVSEIARALDLPRSTAMRAITALQRIGYIRRRKDDSRYLLTDSVLRLSSGYAPPQQLARVAQPLLDAACQVLRWPLTLVLPQGLSLRVAHTTDALTPHKLFTSSAGIQLPLRDTASGLVYLAYCDAETRRMLLEAAEQDPPNSRFPRSDADLQAALVAIGRDGHYFQDHSFVENRQFDGFQTKECLLAVPLLRGRAVVGVLAARMVTRAIRRERIEAELAPRLKALAAQIVAAAEPA